MKCANCNHEISGNVKFCGYCGMPVVVQPIPENDEETRRVCGNCGYSNNRKNNICIKCGSSLTPQLDSENKKNVRFNHLALRRGVIIACVIFGIIVSAILILVSRNFGHDIERKKANRVEHVDSEKQENMEDALAEEAGVMSPEEAMYKPVFDAYLNAIETEDTTSNLLNLYAINYYLYEGDSKIGYALYDIDKDQMPELLMGLDRVGKYEICDVFSLKGNNVVNVLQESLVGSYLLEPVYDFIFASRVYIYPEGEIEIRSIQDREFGIISKNDRMLTQDGIDTEEFENSSQSEINIENLEWVDLAQKSSARILSEKQFKELFVRRMPNCVVQDWRYDDYNNDGAKEAFAIVSEENRNTRELYFISSFGSVQNYAYSETGTFRVIPTFGNKKYAVWQVYDENNIYSAIFTVRDDGVSMYVPLDEEKEFQEIWYDSDLPGFMGVADGEFYYYKYDSANDSFVEYYY